MSDLFVTKKNKYNLRNFQVLESLVKQTVKFGTEHNIEPEVLNFIPKNYGHWQH